ncbi:pogo transposable element with KRAB domain [Rhizophagus clarus]|uniref:Pogo transposable element with KRAB domain n=1 Tax=Rhizophagus clarus TaxID=94130 RepID=A0A8H3QKY8_9GLOM|nr:pogo transposable element with KRAB domain [Rhizophagus clarus]
MWFNLPSNMTINQKEAKMVNILILACIADGMKLPAVCIFKLKNVSKEKFPNSIYISANEKGWVNKQEILWWVENMWTLKNWFGNSRSMLILDSFHGYIVDSVKNQLVKKNTNMAMIPSGCISKLQPLNIVINKSFKSKLINIIQFFTLFLFLVANIDEITVKESWDEISEDLIQKSFKSCGISTNLDGSEDDCISDHDSLLDKDNEMIENSDDSTDENYEEYVKEVNYENKWNIKIDQKEDQEEDNDEDEGEEEDSVYQNC